MPSREAKEPLSDRLKRAVLKPVDADEPTGSDEPQSLEELQAAEKSADDKERIIGLTAAPVAAGIALLEVHNQLINNKAHAGTYNTLLLILFALAMAMLVGAWFRKRMVMAIAMALYGLSVVNLKLWGFGVPFILIGAWMLVRASRAHRAVKDATGGASASGPSSNGAAAPKPSKRYTPPVTKPKRSPT
jgi:hypothetical protein